MPCAAFVGDVHLGIRHYRNGRRPDGQHGRFHHAGGQIPFGRVPSLRPPRLPFQNQTIRALYEKGNRRGRAGGHAEFSWIFLSVGGIALYGYGEERDADGRLRHRRSRRLLHTPQKISVEASSQRRRLSRGNVFPVRPQRRGRKFQPRRRFHYAVRGILCRTDHFGG